MDASFPQDQLEAKLSYGTTRVLAGKLKIAGKRALEELGGSWLDRADLARLDSGSVEIFATRGRAGKTAKHCELAGMSKRIGHRPLEEAIDRGVQWGLRS